MKVVEATCGTERLTPCKIGYEDDNYVIQIDNCIQVRKNQDVYGLGFYEEKALKNCLKKVKDKKIVQQIKKQFRL